MRFAAFCLVSRVRSNTSIYTCTFSTNWQRIGKALTSRFRFSYSSITPGFVLIDNASRALCDSISASSSSLLRSSMPSVGGGVDPFASAALSSLLYWFRFAVISSCLSWISCSASPRTRRLSSRASLDSCLASMKALLTRHNKSGQQPPARIENHETTYPH